MKDKEIISRRIEQLCKEQELTYYMLAYKSAVPLTTIMNIVNCNTRNPGIFTILKLCEGIGISAREFFDTEDFLL